MVARAGDRPEVVVAPGARLGEGPVWDARIGRVVWVDILARRMYLTDPGSGATDEIETPLHLGAVVPRASGGYVAALQDGFWAIGMGAPTPIFRVRREFDQLWQEENKLLPVQVTSAVELDPGTVSQIGDRIAEQTGRKVDLSATVDPDVLGGLVVRVGNSILDASIRNRLEQLRKQVARA